jgi:ubiquinone biosynthesis protein
MAVLMLGLSGGPHLTASVALYQFFGYCLLVIAAIFALECWRRLATEHDLRGASWERADDRHPDAS